MVKGKKILIGVTGSIAAYKTAYLVRLLVKAGAEVRVVMTASAQEFITPLTLSVLSGHQVVSSYTDKEKGLWNNHVDLGCWADLMVIAPLSASTLSKMASGHCDNLLMAVYLSARCPVMVAPAMDLDMWKHQTTTDNILRITGHGVQVIQPTHGALASGLSGEGRMEEPENIFNTIHDFFVKGLSMSGVNVLVTAGPTYEAIDPVRFIGNRSSGKMGFALAQEFAARGATVTLVAGPVSLPVKHPSIRRIDVESAAEMHRSCMAHFPSADVTVMAAAVADFRAASTSASKIKKGTGGMTMELAPTTDILAAMGESRRADQLLVGFALETDNELEHAVSKLKRKHLDYIVLNSLKEDGAGFGHDTNSTTIIGADGETTVTGLKSKHDIARDIVDVLSVKLKK